jgi:hypothetical protein
MNDSFKNATILTQTRSGYLKILNELYFCKTGDIVSNMEWVNRKNYSIFILCMYGIYMIIQNLSDNCYGSTKFLVCRFEKGLYPKQISINTNYNGFTPL